MSLREPAICPAQLALSFSARQMGTRGTRVGTNTAHMAGNGALPQGRSTTTGLQIRAPMFLWSKVLVIIH